jgi:hypothetical protein
MTGMTPALAAPQNMGPSNNGGLDCSLPENANDPMCLQARPPSQPAPAPGNVPQKGTGGPVTSTPPVKGGPAYVAPGKGGAAVPATKPAPSVKKPPPGPTGFKFSQTDRSRFHQQLRGYNFGFFPVPGFTINLGIGVPRSYALRPVPRAIYRYYPQFRGYLFFVSRRGDVVIVSPRTRRIVAVI